jgi:hypothetical protein
VRIEEFIRRNAMKAEYSPLKVRIEEFIRRNAMKAE